MSSHAPIARLIPGQLDHWQEQLVHVQRLLTAVRDRTPCAEDGTDLLKHELRRAQITHVFPNQSNDLYNALTHAAGAAQAAIVTQQRWRRYEDEGVVELQEPDRPSRRIPIGDARLDWPTWVQGFSAALIARDADTLTALCTPESIEACSLPATRIDPFWPFYCSALAATVAEPAAALPLIADARAGLEQATIADPGLIALKLRPLLNLAEKLSTDAETFNTALHQALTAHRQLCQQQAPYDWSGLFALEATALAALACDRGVPLTVESDYLPPALVSGSFPRDLSQVTYHFPQRSILSASEAHWFLDLAGFPRQGRSHQLLQEHDQLIARYTAHNAPGLPHAVAPFVLLDQTTILHPSPPPALDAGQLLALAETFASQPTADPQQTNAHLSEAIDCIDAALARIPPDQATVPADTLTSPQGQHLYQAEPGRFRRDRLTAYRNSLLTTLQSLSPHLPISPSPTLSPRDTALTLIDLLRTQLTPLLQALAQDTTGDIVDQLIPLDDDYAQVFVGAAVARARRTYQQLWSKSRRFQRPASNQSEILCYLAPAGMLRDKNELSRHFPQGYQAIAADLNPHRVWVAWQYRQPGEASGLAFDGLVWVEDHWAWFPKPYRMLRRSE